MVFDLKKRTALLIFFQFFYAKRPVKIDWVKNSKFRKLTFFGMIILHIFPNFDDDCMKTLGGVRANARNMLILSIRLTPVTLTLVGRPRPYCPEVTVININISWMFRENQIMARGSKGCDRQTDRRTSWNKSSWLLHIGINLLQERNSFVAWCYCKAYSHQLFHSVSSFGLGV